MQNKFVSQFSKYLNETTISAAISLYGRCVKKCDPNYVARSLIVPIDIIGDLIAKITRSVVAEVCVCKCKIALYEEQGNLKKVEKWKSKLNQTVEKAKNKAKNLELKGKKEEAKFLLKSLNQMLSKKF